MPLSDEVRRFWDDDSATYDDSPSHHPHDPAEQAAWSAALEALLPPPPSRVLDCGAGTGFLSLGAALLGHRVTALDLSPGMLERLRVKARAAGVSLDVVEGPAESPPAGGFDAVIERHLVWTLPDPLEALRSWHAAAPAGRLVLFEGAWGQADPWHKLRVAARRLSAARSDHHAEYPPAVRARLPLGGGTTPSALAALAAEAGWATPRLHRLRDVEWAASAARPWPERALGVPPRFAVVAGS